MDSERGKPKYTEVNVSHSWFPS